MKCNNIQTRKKPRSTRLQLENENTEGKSFRWKSDHLDSTIFKVETTEKEDTDRISVVDFPTTISQFKKGSRPIDEAKPP